MKNQLVAFYDGRCPMCTEGVKKFGEWEQHARVKFVDLHSDEARAAVSGRFTTNDLMREMIVQMPDTTFRVGYFAWIAILASSKRFAGIANLMDLPFLYSVGPIVYQFTADHRLGISKILGLPEPCTEDSACAIS